MQKYLILVNVEDKATGLVPVPECFELKGSVKVGAGLLGIAALVGYLAWEPSPLELADGAAMLELIRTI